MKKVKEYVKQRLLQFLGIDELQHKVTAMAMNLHQLDAWLGSQHAIEAAAVDVHMSRDSESLVIICSRLKGGMIKFIPVEFRDVSILLDTIRYLENRFEPARGFYIDGPPVLVREIDDQLKRRRRRRWQA
jgi:hypothetical protein